MRGGGYYWTVVYPAIGAEKWEGRESRKSDPVAFWTLLGIKEGEKSKRFLSNAEMLRAYWLREGGEAYRLACQQCGITELEPEILESAGLDWRAIQRAEEERIEKLRKESKARREARIAEMQAKAPQKSDGAS
jgi:hypothetical protein